MHTFFTSESVCAGHPDKIADQISDAVVDAVLATDPVGRVAVETMVTADRVILVGEVSAQVTVDYAEIARRQIRRLGYVYPQLHFTDQVAVEVAVHAQSPEIARGVNHKGAGDQGMMFGYACTETKQYMPLPITIAHALTAGLDRLREAKTLSYLLPDGKSQVTLQYEKGQAVEVTSVVLAAPYLEKVEAAQVKIDLVQHLVTPVLAEYGFRVRPEQVIVNGTGVWHFSGPAADSGLTGRKIVVDTYGGYARVGGGCFSGKDPSKVDRSGAYAARYIAKNIVAHGLATRAEVSLAYYIGARQPIMKEVETFGTATVRPAVLADFVEAVLDTSVEGIIDGLQLRRPIYLPTAAYGHFGRAMFPWEQISATMPTK